MIFDLFIRLLPRADYLKEVEIWYKQLLPRTVKHLYGKGGNVIMVQVENEYGSFECDHVYTEWLRDLTKKYVDDKAVLFTTDMPNENAIRCGRIPDVFTTIDFGPGECDLYFFSSGKNIIEKNGEFFFCIWLIEDN